MLESLTQEVFSRHSYLLATIWVSFITTCYIINLSRHEQVCLMIIINKYVCLPMEEQSLETLPHKTYLLMT